MVAGGVVTPGWETMRMASQVIDPEVAAAIDQIHAGLNSLFAAGLSLIFGVMRLVNIAHGDMIVLAAIGIAASVIGAFYYLKVVKVMYFDEPAEVAVGKSDWAHQAVLAICALVISPLGYLLVLTGWLGELADKAAAVLFLAA